MLGPVTGLTQTGQSGTSTAFAWNDDLDADFYLVGVDAQTPVQVAALAATVVAPAGSHTVKVAPGLAATPPATLSFSVAPPPPPPVPTGVAPGNVTASSIVLRWNASAGASSYTVFMNGAALSPNPTATSLTINGLQPGTAYQFSVVANGAGLVRGVGADHGDHEHHPAATAAVLGLDRPGAGRRRRARGCGPALRQLQAEALLMLGPVLNLQQTAQDATGTTFSWDAVALADAYAVSLDGTLVSTVTATTVKLTASAGAHTIGVAPVANATPPTTLPFSVSATPPPVPTGLTVVLGPETQPVGVILNWNPSAGAVKYQILENGSALGAEPPVSSGVVVQGQSLGQTYAYQVAAIDAAGNEFGVLRGGERDHPGDLGVGAARPDRAGGHAGDPERGRSGLRPHPDRDRLRLVPGQRRLRVADHSPLVPGHRGGARDHVPLQRGGVQRRRRRAAQRDPDQRHRAQPRRPARDPDRAGGEPR